jgi:hypothetical protein
VANKTGKGGFKAGASGNPGGRPKAASVIAIEARKHGLAMVDVLNTIARKGKSEQARISAAVALLDRGYGRPSQSVELKFPRRSFAEASARNDAGRAAHS